MSKEIRLLYTTVTTTKFRMASNKKDLVLTQVHVYRGLTVKSACTMAEQPPLWTLCFSLRLWGPARPTSPPTYEDSGREVCCGLWNGSINQFRADAVKARLCWTTLASLSPSRLKASTDNGDIFHVFLSQSPLVIPDTGWTDSKFWLPAWKVFCQPQRTVNAAPEGSQVCLKSQHSLGTT